LSNLTTYSFAGKPEHEIKIRLKIDSDLLIEVEDEGPPFNPLTVSPVDTSAPLETRPIGGLGVHLMRDFMDGLDYSRVGGRNILRMRKRLQP
jgi:anti-sigma regulatory factor (Ser/Thr protein kinase)